MKPTVENDIVIVDYLWIARYVAAKYTRERPIEDSIEYSDACLGLCKAKRLYDPSVGSFRPLAFVAADRVVRDGKRRKREKARGRFHNWRRYNSPSELESEEPEDYRHRPEPFQDEIDLAVTLAKRTLSHNDFQILLRRCYGKTNEEIGQEFGITKERVRQVNFRVDRELAVYRK